MWISNKWYCGGGAGSSIRNNDGNNSTTTTTSSAKRRAIMAPGKTVTKQLALGTLKIGLGCAVVLYQLYIAHRLARSPTTLMDNVPAFGNSVHGGTTVRSMYDWLGHGLVSMEDVGLQRDMARPKGGSLLPLFGCGQAPRTPSDWSKIDLVCIIIGLTKSLGPRVRMGWG
ncbi:hypothetical protein QR685DRAFT_579358 [Neurospora intermedia]|uniref:Uncharacterized protein n=1 Tax=Neurospora intermedia TaxID=5142 RepID=A0ABR3DV26_NEUIN